MSKIEAQRATGEFVWKHLKNFYEMRQKNASEWTPEEWKIQLEFSNLTLTESLEHLKEVRAANPNIPIEQRTRLDEDISILEKAIKQG